MDTVECFCTNSRRAALALSALYDQALEPHALKTTQFSLLRAVERSGPRNLTELAAATGLDRSTLGRNLRLLECAGLVSLEPGDDQRDRVVQLTSSGKRRIRAATASWRRVQDTAAAALGPDAARLLAVTRRVAGAIRGLAQGTRAG